MTADKNGVYRLTSWNGVSIAAPISWEAVVTGTNHLLFESKLTPVFEIRWEKISAKASSNSVDRSISQIEMLSGRKLCSIPTPGFSKKLLPGFETSCYSWQGHERAAVMLLYCRPCSLFFLLQFFQDDRHSTHPLRFIELLSCHTDQRPERLWSIQDFRVKIPRPFLLSGFNLAAGFSKLSFLQKKTIIQICRIAPAGIRLQQQNLTQIFTTLAGLNSNDSIGTIGEASIEYERYPSIGAQILMRLRKKKPFCLATLWHDEVSDRILCVIMESTQPLDQLTFNAICNSYEILPPQKK